MDRTVQASAVFPFNPLTTTFTAPGTRCTGINFPTTLNNIAMFHDEPSCLPAGFNSAQTAYFSPGLICPSGYYSACHDTAGIASVTTVTCCPALADRGITFTCVDPKTLAGVFTSKFCSWQAPASPGLPVSVTRSDTSKRTSTIVDTMINPGGINAFGIRMVHQATDLSTLSSATPTTAGSSGPGPAPGVTAPAQDGKTGSQVGVESSSGLSQGAMIGIGVAAAVVAVAALAGLFLWWRKRRRAAAGGALLAESPQEAAPGPENKYYYSGQPQQVHELKSGGWAPVPTSATELSSTGIPEMPGHSHVAELPAERHR